MVGAANTSKEEFDFIIVGSGFGGSVSAMRLSQKGYRVGILEMGRRWRDDEFPHSNWNLGKYLWAPLLRCFGIQGIKLLRGIMVLHGVGVGGGSLVYANTLMEPKPEVFDDPAWPKGAKWRGELKTHYQTAKKMLGVSTNPFLSAGEEALREVAKRLNVEPSFHPTEVGVYFGEPKKEEPDPYFGKQSGTDRYTVRIVFFSPKGGGSQ